MKHVLSTPRVAPSVLAADLGRLREHVGEVIAAGAEVIHIDVMDGAFVPPLSLGPGHVKALRGLGAYLDVHLMVEHPERQIDQFADAGADGITFHAEATAHAHRLVEKIRERGCRAGIAVCPATALDVFEQVEVDLALCMTVNPGWGGQAFIEGSLARVARLRSLVGPVVEVEVDGGVDIATAGPCAAAGASLLVAGTAVFGAPDAAAAFSEIVAALRRS